MPPNQHIIGGCNQIISLRFGFPNSFPKLPSADRSLAFRMRGERWREANDLRRNLNNREKRETEEVVCRRDLESSSPGNSVIL